MPRAPSVILTPTEKKVVTTQTKGELKDGKAKLAQLNKTRANLVKAHAATTKELNNQIRGADKALAGNLKEVDKAIAQINVANLALEAKLAKLNPPKELVAGVEGSSVTTQ